MLIKRIWSDLRKVTEENPDTKWFQLQPIDETYGEDKYPQVVLEVDFNKNPFKTGREMSFAFEIADRITSEQAIIDGNYDLSIINCLSKMEILAENIIAGLYGKITDKEYTKSGLNYEFIGMIDFIDKDADKRTGWRVEMKLATLKPYPNFCIPFDPAPPPNPPICNVLIAGGGLSLNVNELTVGVSFSSIIGLEKIELYIRDTLSAFVLIDTIIVPVDNTATDFQFIVDMSIYPPENYWFQINAFHSCEPSQVASSIELNLIAPPAVQQIYPINEPQKRSIEEWALLTPPVPEYTYKIEFAGSYGNSKFVDQNGTLNPMLFIDGSNWYNPRIIWDYAGINTQIIDVYIQMTIYGPSGQTVCGLVNAPFTNIVVISPTVWLRGAINSGITLNSTGVLENVYGPDSPEYFTQNGVNSGLPNPYGNIKMASGFHTYLNAFLVDVIKIELREEDQSNIGFPSDGVVDSAFMWCLAPDSYGDAVTRKCVDFLTAKSSFIALNADPEIDYYVVIKHRNHLCVSSKKIRLDKMGSVTNMDFRTDVLLNTGGSEIYTDGLGLQFMQYGNAHDEIGDIGEVNATDDFLVGQDNGLYVEYSRTDLNLDGNVDSNDVSIVSEGTSALYYSGVPNAGL